MLADKGFLYRNIDNISLNTTRMQKKYYWILLHKISFYNLKFIRLFRTLWVSFILIIFFYIHFLDLQANRGRFLIRRVNRNLMVYFLFILFLINIFNSIRISRDFVQLFIGIGLVLIMFCFWLTLGLDLMNICNFIFEGLKLYLFVCFLFERLIGTKNAAHLII